MLQGRASRDGSAHECATVGVGFRSNVQEGGAQHVDTSVSLKQRVSQLELESGLDRKAALKQAARERGLGKREAYKQLLLER